MNRPALERIKFLASDAAKALPEEVQRGVARKVTIRELFQACHERELNDLEAACIQKLREPNPAAPVLVGAILGCLWFGFVLWAKQKLHLP